MLFKILLSFLYFFYKLFFRIKKIFRKKKILTQDDLRLIKFMKHEWNIDCTIDEKNYYHFDFTEYDKQKNIKRKKYHL